MHVLLHAGDEFRGKQVFDVQGWSRFEGHIPADERPNLVAAYHKRLTSDNTAVRDAAVSMPLFDTCSAQTLVAVADPAALKSPSLQILGSSSQGCTASCITIPNCYGMYHMRSRVSLL